MCTCQPPKANSGVGKWVPASAGKTKAGMVHSVSGWTRCVQVKLWDPLRTRAIPERLRVCSRRGAIQIHVYLTLPYLTLPANRNELSSSRFSKVRALQTDRQTDRQTGETERIIALHLRMVKILSCYYASNRVCYNLKISIRHGNAGSCDLKAALCAMLILQKKQRSLSCLV